MFLRFEQLARSLLYTDTDSLTPEEIIKSHMAMKHRENNYSVSEETLESWNCEKSSINV